MDERPEQLDRSPLTGNFPTKHTITGDRDRNLKSSNINFRV